MDSTRHTDLAWLAAAAGMLGIIAYLKPVAGIGAALVCGALALGRARPRALPVFFAALIGVVLVGYAFFGRPFAYLGVAPLYIGEFAMATGILFAMTSADRLRGFRSPIAWLILAFSIWGALQTLPYLGQYGIDALRDAVLWGYALIALLVIPLLPGRDNVERVIAGFGRLVPFFLAWILLHFVLISFVGPSRFPSVPGSGISVLAAKAGDHGVHLAGAGAFLLLGLTRLPDRARARWYSSDWILWTLWVGGFLIVASRNRGGFLAMAIALAIVLLSGSAAWRRLLPVLAVVAVVLPAAVVADLSIDRSGAGKSRHMSVEQVAVNISSIWGGESNLRNDNTRQWRLEWWKKIVNYTVHGPYFWTGKGYGINLADDDGYQVISGEKELRSPHNGHLTILARSGVPGALLWGLLLIAFALSLLRAGVRARRAGNTFWYAVNIWVLAYWAAFLTNSTFDVFLEGPQGGIAFWALTGFGVAVVLIQQPERLNESRPVASESRKYSPSPIRLRP
jgi:hypothetical protein